MQGNRRHSLGSPPATKTGHKRFGGAVLLILLGLFAWNSSCSRSRDPARPTAPADLLRHAAAAGFNLLLITLDTTRADRLGCYGYEQAETPTIDALAGRGVRFDDAVTSVPITLPSHATIMTGRYPPAIGVRDNGTYQLAEEHVTLAEILKGNGYDAVAFVASFTLDERFGLNQGFDLYEFEVGPDGRKAGGLAYERRADAVSDSAIGWLQARDESGGAGPFFMWVHYFDPHVPYDSPIGPAARFRGRPYDAEIAFVDLQLKRLLAAFDERGLRDRTLIVLVSDHGEGLFEHDEATHGIFIYETTLRVALILSCPALFDGPYRVDDRVVATVDLLPTILDLLDVPSGMLGDGQSLLAAAGSPQRAVYIETQMPLSNGCSPLYGLRRHGDKYIQAPRPEYYNLQEDPKELQNLYSRGPLELVTLKEQLAEVMDTWSGDEAGRSAARLLTDEERRRLESLGYVAGDEQSESDALPDPKDHISVINQMTEITRLMALGQEREALALAKEVAAQSEDWYDPIRMVAELHWKLGERAEALSVLEEFAEKHPSPDVLYQLARTLFFCQREAECLEKLAAAELLDAQAGAIPVLRGDVFFRQKRYQRAVEQYQRALEIDGKRFGPEARRKLRQAKQGLRGTQP